MNYNTFCRRCGRWPADDGHCACVSFLYRAQEIIVSYGIAAALTATVYYGASLAGYIYGALTR